MFITLMEIFDVILMTFVIGFVFMKTFRPVKKTEDILDKYLKKAMRFDWHALWFAAMVTAPAIILHELGHKLTALSFGLSAEFHAAYFWLALAIVLRLVNFPFIFFVPAYTSISGNATIAQQVWTAFAGPGVNLVLFLTAYIVLKSHKNISITAAHFWTLTRDINLFLFIFNMIPIPGFDGFTVFSGLWKILGL
jgi:Zn-dependent protease